MSAVRWFLLLLSGLVVGCFVPHFYRVTFPASGVEAIPKALFEDSAEVLVFPCWHWYQGPGDGLGPPVIVPSRNLGRLSEELASWRGFEMIDLFGHEGGEAPVACGVVLIGSSGTIVRLDHSYQSPRSLEEEGRFFWKREVATVGPQLKVALEEALANQTVSPDSLEMVFGITYAEVLGESSALAPALRFVEQLDASGDDVWRPVLRQVDESLE